MGNFLKGGCRHGAAIVLGNEEVVLARPCKAVIFECRRRNVPVDIAVGDHRVEVGGSRWREGWRLRAKTHPNQAEVWVTLSSPKEGLPRVTTWERVR